jgi:enolase
MSAFGTGSKSKAADSSVESRKNKKNFAAFLPVIFRSADYPTWASARTANSLLYRALADECKPVMPPPVMSIMNGEKCDGNDLSLFMVIAIGLKTFRDSLRCGAEIYHALRARLEAKVCEAEGQRVIPT